MDTHIRVIHLTIHDRKTAHKYFDCTFIQAERDVEENKTTSLIFQSDLSLVREIEKSIRP